MSTIPTQFQELTAKNLQRRYRAGERHFVRVDLSGESLRGMNLKGIDLSESDLSHTDIRGTNFTEAKLIGTKFLAAKAGIQRRWLLLQFILIILQVIIGSFFLTLIWSDGLSVFDAYYNPPSDPLTIKRKFLETITGTTKLVVGFIFLMLTYVRSFTVGLTSALATFAFVVLVLFLSAFIIPFLVSSGEPTTYEIVSSIFDPAAIITTIALSFAGTAIVCICVAVSLANSIVYVVTVVAAFFISTAYSTLFAIANNDNLDFWGIVNWYGIVIQYIGVSTNLVICYLIARRAISGDSRERFIRDISVWIGSWGGTKFTGSDLSESSFSRAVLKGVHLNQANLTRVKFHLSRKTNLSRFGKTILTDFRVQNLLITLRGSGESYSGLNLKGAYLAGADLVDADFTEADLSQAMLEGATLERANLTKTQALGTNFHQAIFTGATLEAWNIDSTTQLNDAVCEHVYLIRNQQERRPSSGSFAPGEFSKLFQEVLDTVDLIFQNGIDWKAFVHTFNQIKVQYEKADLIVQAIENKGDGVFIVKLNAAPGADKSSIHQSFYETYQIALQAVEARYKAQLDAKDDQIAVYRQKSADMQNIAELLAQRPINVQATAESKAMQGNDYSQKISVGGDATSNIFQSGKDNTASLEFQQVMLPPADSINIQAELAVLQDILASFNRPVIDVVMSELQEEAAKPTPDKSVIATTLETGLTYARNLQGFTEAIDKLRPHVKNAAGWLGEHGTKLLPIVGLTL